MSLRYTPMNVRPARLCVSAWALVCFNLSLFACSGAPSQGAGSASAPLPAWVMAPPEGLCGLGTAPARPTLAVARTVATARGRAALASRVELQVKNLLRSFELEGGESMTQQLSAQSVSQRLIGSKVLKEHQGEGELFVLVCVGGDRVVEAIEREVQTREVSPKGRARLRQRSAEAFRELEEQMREAFSEDEGLD